MNFKWCPTILSDIPEFNTWSKTPNASVGNRNVNNIKEFLCGKKEFGNQIKLFLSKNYRDQMNAKEKCLTVRDIESEQIIGFVMVCKLHVFNEIGDITEKHEANIDMIAVNPALQGCGIGTAMLFDLVKNREQILEYNPVKISANVKRENSASLKMFSNNNFNSSKNSLGGYYKEVELDLNQENSTAKKENVNFNTSGQNFNCNAQSFNASGQNFNSNGQSINSSEKDFCTQNFDKQTQNESLMLESSTISPIENYNNHMLNAINEIISESIVHANNSLTKEK